MELFNNKRLLECHLQKKSKIHFSGPDSPLKNIHDLGCSLYKNCQFCSLMLCSTQLPLFLLDIFTIQVPTISGSGYLYKGSINSLLYYHNVLNYRSGGLFNFGHMLYVNTQVKHKLAMNFCIPCPPESHRPSYP